METKKKGFAALSPERRREIASMGGIASSKDSKEMALRGSKGGKATSKDLAHMAAIGRKGSRSRQYSK